MKMHLRYFQPFSCFFLFVPIALLLLSGCGGGTHPEIKMPGLNPPPPAMKCNGHTELCGRRYNEVVYAATHNSMSNIDEGWNFPNQEHGIARQLDDGIRALYLDIHYFEDQVYLCHAQCDLGKESLLSGLGKIKTFMDANPNEVITIVFESYVDAADAAAVFTQAGLDAYAHAQPEDAAWPTLGDMIRSGKRLVVFHSRSDADEPPWYMYEWDYTWSSPYHFESADEFNCGFDRGSADNAVFEVPHFITNPLPNRFRAEEVNTNPVFIDRMRDCIAQSGRLPNIVSVDYYSLGNIFDVVDALNGF